MQQATIEIKLSQDNWEDLFHQDDENDVTPDDLTVVFDKDFVSQSRQILHEFPALDSVGFKATITSENFIGEIQCSKVNFYNQSKQIYASFTNGNTGTDYELNITHAVSEILMQEKSENSSDIPADNIKSVFDKADTGKSIVINSSHLPQEDFEELLDLVNQEPIRIRGGLIEYFFLVDTYLNVPGSFGVKLQHTPWNDEKLQQQLNANSSQLKQELFDHDLPSSFIDLLFQIGEAGYEVLIIDLHAQVIEGLRTFSD